MAQYDYEFILDSGRKFYVCAESRKKAVELFLEEHGMPEDFFKKHCTVKCLGRVLS